MHREQTGVVAVADPRVEDGERLALPAQPEVALVGHHDGPAFARPAHHLPQVVDAEDFAGRVRRRVDEHQRRVHRAEGDGRVGPDGASPGQQGTDLIGRVGDLGDHHVVSRAEAEGRRQAGDRLLGADDRQDPRLVEVRHAVAPGERLGSGLAQFGGPDGRRVSRESGRVGQCVPDELRHRVDRRTDRQVDDAVGMGLRRGLGTREGVPREIGQPTAHTRRRHTQRRCCARGGDAHCGASPIRPGVYFEDGKPSSRQSSSFMGGRPLMKAGSASVLPTLLAPPGEPRSSKKSALALT